MGVDVLDSTFDVNSPQIEDVVFGADGLLNGVDARRRLEDKIEEIRLRKEMQEFDFDI